MKKQMTLEHVAGMVKRGLDEMGEGMKKGFEAVDRRFDVVEARLVNIESDIVYLKARVTELGRMLDEHTEILAEHSKILAEHSKELRFLHRKLDEMTDPKSPKHLITFKEFSQLELRVTALEKKILAKI